ncbi:MAG: ABC transporter ATP-binding protein, partial [Shewanella sp.]
ARVVEISGDDLRTLKPSLMSESVVLSAAQIGRRLRVLVRSDIEDPLAWLKPSIASRAIEEVRASLEGVFVTCTLERLTELSKGEIDHVA